MATDVTAVEAQPRPEPKPAPANGEKKQQPVVNKDKVGNDVKAAELEQAAEQAVNDVAREIKKGEIIEKFRRGGETPAQPVAARGEEPHVLAEQPVRPLTEYFPQLPTHSVLAQEAERLRYEAAGQTLTQLADSDIGYLMKQYLKLRLLARQVKADTTFLSSIEQVLSQHGINTYELYIDRKSVV